jgi:dual-specificity kinase
MCVYDFLKDNEFAPFPRHQIQSFAKQLLGSVACTFFPSQSRYPTTMTQAILFAVLHELHLVHTDLKPENILLVNNSYSVVHVPIPGKVCCLCFQAWIARSLTPGSALARRCTSETHTRHH